MAPTVGIYHAVLIIEKYYIPWVYQHIMAYINVYQCSILYNIYLYIYISTPLELHLWYIIGVVILALG
jgi:predicted DNA-binding protein (UPF0278 family)